MVQLNGSAVAAKLKKKSNYYFSPSKMKPCPLGIAIVTVEVIALIMLSSL
jgi:hypothetical protein